MAVKIKLKRMGKIRAPYYRIVVADSRTKRDGRAIEEVGKYHPTQEPSLIQVDSERVQYWLSVGAQPTEAVAALLRVTGDWQRFKGLPGAEGTLRVAGPRADKKAAFDEAAREAMAAGEGKAGAGKAGEGRAGAERATAGAPRGKRAEARPAPGGADTAPAAGAEAAETSSPGGAEAAQTGSPEGADTAAPGAEPTAIGKAASTPEQGGGARTDGPEA